MTQPAIIAKGKPVKNRNGKYTPQVYHTKNDIIEVTDNNALYSVVVGHGLTLPPDATEEQKKELKARLDYFVPGGLISGGADKPITGSNFGKPEFDIHTRRKGNIGPTHIAALDIDNLSEAAFMKLTGGEFGCNGILEQFHGLTYETVSSKPGERRIRICIFTEQPITPEDKPMAYARIEQALMKACGATRCTIEKTNVNGDISRFPGWQLEDGITAFDTSAPRETQLMYGCPANPDWPVWLFDGKRLDLDSLPELDADIQIEANKQAQDDWKAPANGAGELGEYLLANGLAEWHNDKTLNVICAWGEDHGSGEPGEINNSTYLKLDAIESKMRFGCSHTGCHAAGHWSEAEPQARFARRLGVPEDIIARTFGAESVIHDFEQLEPVKERAVAVDAEMPSEQQQGDADLTAEQQQNDAEMQSNDGEFDLAEGWRNVDLAAPPGLAGDLVEGIDRTAYRELKPAAVAVALQIIALAAGIGKRRTMNDGKPSITTITIGETAAGKESSISFYKSMFSAIHYAKNIVGTPRSDKDLILNLIHADAVNGYVIDEAHAYMSSISDKNSSEFKRALGGLMLEMATTDRFILAGVHARELGKDLDSKRKQLAKLQKQITAAEEKAGTDLSDEALSYIAVAAELQKEITKLSEVLDEGIQSPVVNFAMSSTPAKFDEIINNADIASGLLGRGLVFRCNEGRAKLRQHGILKFSLEDNYFLDLVRRVDAIADSKKQLMPFEVMKEAALLMADIFEHFESDYMRNAPITGGLYARGMERITLLCSLLAMESRIVTAEMVQWAYAQFMAHVEDTTSLARQNAADGISVKLQIAILAALKKGRAPLSTLSRITRKAIFAEAEQQAALRNKPSPFQEALDIQLEVGNIELVGKSYRLKRKK